MPINPIPQIVAYIKNHLWLQASADGTSLEDNPNYKKMNPTENEQIGRILSRLQVRTLVHGHDIATINDTDERLLNEATAEIQALLVAARVDENQMYRNKTAQHEHHYFSGGADSFTCGICGELISRSTPRKEQL